MRTAVVPTHAVGSYDHARPALSAGDYLVSVEQRVHLPKEYASPERLRADQVVRVTGPHFELGPDDIVSVHPPASGEGDFAATLCHAVLSRPSLPWEIDAGSGAGLATPWLALLLLADDEVVRQPDGGRTGAWTVPLADYLDPAESGTLGPDLPRQRKDRWLAELPDQRCTVVDVPADAFAAVAPLAGELAYLAHVRETTDGQVAVVVGNRLATARNGPYVAHLVSLEGFIGRLGDRGGLPSGTSAVRLLSLGRWTFTSTPGSGYFGELMDNLHVDVLRLPKEPPQAPPEPAGSRAGALVHTALAHGYVPADHRTRLGERTTAWYRGPLLPVRMQRNRQPRYAAAEAAMVYDPQTGMFDLSYATAWQTGRLLALADREFTASLLSWVRANHRLAHLVAERIQLCGDYEMAGRPDTVADLVAQRAVGRRLRRYLARDLAPLISGAPAGSPVFGPPGDPSGLHDHIHRLPGLRTAAEIAALLDGRADPHTAVLRGPEGSAR